MHIHNYMTEGRGVYLHVAATRRERRDTGRGDKTYRGEHREEKTDTEWEVPWRPQQPQRPTMR